MKKERKSWFQGINYKVEFGHNEVPSFDGMKRVIDTHVMLSVVDFEELRDII